MDRSNEDETVDAGDFEGGVLEVLEGLEEVVVEDEFAEVAYTVRVEVRLVREDAIRWGVRIGLHSLFYI